MSAPDARSRADLLDLAQSLANVAAARLLQAHDLRDRLTEAERLADELADTYGGAMPVRAEIMLRELRGLLLVLREQALRAAEAALREGTEIMSPTTADDAAIHDAFLRSLT